MKATKSDLQSLSIDELWALHEQVDKILSERIMAEKQGLEERLARLNGRSIDKATAMRGNLKTGSHRANSKVSSRRGVRRKYPPVLPKYHNPSDPSQTWSGRGKQPRWLVSQLKAGKKINEFLISVAVAKSATKRRAA